jgi:hypothetical protein
MNVDEAMEAAAEFNVEMKVRPHWTLFSETVAVVLAAEVERLRAELQLRDDYDKRVPDPRDHKFFDQTCGEHGCKSRQIDILKAKLAEAKAASRCPARVENIYDAEYPSDCYIECWNGDECMKFREWLYDRMKEGASDDS